MFCSFLSAFLFVVLFSAAGGNTQVVKVTGGMIEGSKDKFAFYFKGVPFAAPPVGTLRFSDPVPVVPWSGILPTKTFSAGCMQKCSLPRSDLTCPKNISEDCLYLNVYTPTLNPSAKLKVMVFIHGGAWVAGAAGTTLYESTRLANEENMVVVAGNYRMGVFGSYYDGKESQGNFGLKDQRFLLEWVQYNIMNFGGDPNSVTISGQSAGAMSVGAHIASPLSQPLFKAAIMSSNPFGILFAEPKLSSALAFYTQLATNCTSGSPIACLRRKSAEDLLKASEHIRNLPMPSHPLAAVLPWIPTVTGDDQLPVQPLFVNSTSLNKPVNVMAGVMANDSTYFVYSAFSNAASPFVVELLIGYIFGKDKEKIYAMYGKPKGKDARDYLGDILQDYIFYCPNRYYARGMAERGSSNYFKNIFAHVPSFSDWIWQNSSVPYCSELVCHCDDLPFIFSSQYYINNSPKPTPEELTLLKWVQDSYGNFVNTIGGSMNPNNATEPAWPPAYNKAAGTAGVDATMVMDAPLGHMIHNHKSVICDMWDKIGYNHH